MRPRCTYSDAIGDDGYGSVNNTIRSSSDQDERTLLISPTRTVVFGKKPHLRPYSMTRSTVKVVITGLVCLALIVPCLLETIRMVQPQRLPPVTNKQHSHEVNYENTESVSMLDSLMETVRYVKLFKTYYNNYYSTNPEGQTSVSPKRQQQDNTDDSNDTVDRRDSMSNTLQSTKSRDESNREKMNTIETSTNGIPMPSGVNLGSWLALEDYFYVGSTGAVEVATPDDKIAAVCLPPLHTGSPGPAWQSETDLLTSLIDQIGIAKALQVFHAHRTSFIDFDTDFALLQQLGITNVRVPMSWCLTDYDPSTINITHSYAANETLLLRQQFTCMDPFYQDIHWAAIPKSLIIQLLRACSKYGIQAVFDIHTYPGATSIGTFSGLWPKWPRFWTHGDHPEDLEIDVGRKLFKGTVDWMERLADVDPIAFSAVRGISSMNEPAHLAGLFGSGASSHPTKQSFLPDLPTDIAKSFLHKINQPQSHPNVPNFTIVPDGTHLRVLLWLTDSVKIFRESKLPDLGKEIHVNIHESIFHPSVISIVDGTNNDLALASTQLIASWWASITTPKERSSWSILDMHRYHAWDHDCQGTVDGGSDLGSYVCSDETGRNAILDKCAMWASSIYRKSIDDECGPGAKIVSAEFSAATHHLVKHACNDITTLRATYTKQVHAAQQANVELFWWSFKMPYGGSFRNAWSFQHLMYLLGVVNRPDEPTFDCNQHIPTKDEPMDPIFDTAN